MSKHEISEAVAVLQRGGLVAFPTETVYGLGCDARSPDALRRLYAVKGRPAEHPVIVHLPDAEALPEWALTVPAAARTLAASCWPGPVTIVVPRAAHVLDQVTGGNDTVALRVPRQRVALELLREFGGGIAAPSANRFGRVSPTSASDVRADLGDDVDLVLDDGPCVVGVESTIVDCTGDPPVIVRQGGCSREHLEAVLGVPLAVADDGRRAAPGTLRVHYSPNARVVIVQRADVSAAAESHLAMGERVGLLALDPGADVPAAVVCLDTPSDVDEYARVLYTRLREADGLGLDVLLAVAPPTSGVGAAIGDRLRRAAGRDAS